MQVVSISGLAARDFALPARHRLIVRAVSGNTPLHRMGDGAVTHNYEIAEGEEWSLVSDRPTRWRVGPAVGFASIKIETENLK